VLRLRVKKGDEGVGGVLGVLCLLMTVVSFFMTVVVKGMREVLFLLMTGLCFFMTVVGVVHFGGDVNKGKSVL
jgi:hypothetical protein